jgi:nitrite reductase (NADH) small subunit
MNGFSPTNVSTTDGPHRWLDVCAETDLTHDRGVCALVGETPIALFKVSPNGSLFALSNIDPFTNASVLSRGIVGSKGDTMKITSPMLKHAFNLETGESLDDPLVQVQTFLVRVVDGRVQVATESAPPTSAPSTSAL